MDNNLAGKTYVVTGATSGIGLAAAKELIRQGAAVIGIGRSQERCNAAEQQLRASTAGCQIDTLCADLSLQSQVRQAAVGIRAILARQGKSYLDGLVNNAGTFTYWQIITPEGFETQWAVNHLAPFLLTNELLPLLQAAPAGRIVTVSSDSHQGARLNWDDIQLRRGYNGLRAYGQTKLANILFTLEFNRRVGAEAALHAYAVDPGLVKTEIGFKGTPALVRWIWMQRRRGGVPVERPARSIVTLLSEPSAQNSKSVYWKDGKPRQPSSRATDPESARRLWALSEQMVQQA